VTRALAAALVLVPAIAAADPDCKRFGGMIHGQSKCMAYDLATKRVVPSTARVMPGKDVASADCDGELALGEIAVRIQCDGDRNHVAVSMKLVRGGDSGWVRLDRHDGYHDFVNVWAKRDKGAIRFTIDYGILD
jgi:hypothetical protein